MSDGTQPPNGHAETGGSSPLFEWRDAMAESALPSSCKLVLWTLSKHMNTLGGSCYVGTRRLTDETSLARNTVLAAIRQCESEGWLNVTPGAGRATSSYTATIPSGAVSEPQTPVCGAVTEPQEVSHKPVVARSEPRSGAIERRSGATTAPKDVEDEELEDENTLAFEAFWRDYPRKLAKRVVRQKFAPALKRTDAATLLAGLATWCAYWREAGTEEKYIPHPTTWLNRDDWDRTPPPVSKRNADAAAARVAAAVASRDKPYLNVSYDTPKVMYR